MRLKVLHRGPWQVLAPIDDREACEVLEALAALAADKKTKATAGGFLAQWQRIPVEGPRRLGTDIYHCVDDSNEIYEFIKGAHRLLCFEASGRVVVCSHLMRKKKQKTPTKDKKRAAALRDEYLAAVKSGSVEIIAEEE